MGTVMDRAKNNIKKLIEKIDKPILNDYEIEEKIVVETKYNLRPRPRKNNEKEVNGYKLKTNNKYKCKKCTTEENVNKNGK